MAARVTGAAQARLLWGLDYFASTMDRFAEAAARPGPGPEENPLVETMRPAAERYGLEIDDELLLGQWTVDPASRASPAHQRPDRADALGALLGADGAPPLAAPPAGAAPRRALPRAVPADVLQGRLWDHVPGLLEMVSDLDVEVVATLNADQLAGMPTCRRTSARWTTCP